MESITYIQGTLFYNMNTNEKQINDKTFNSYQYNCVGNKLAMYVIREEYNYYWTFTR